MTSQSVRADGYNGQIEVSDTVLRIGRSGLVSLLTQGLKGDKEILLSEITSVQFKPAGILTNGYIQFAFRGGQEALGGLFQAGGNENSVMFTAAEQPAVEVLN